MSGFSLFTAVSKERVAIKLATLKLKDTIKKYWIDAETNIFKNYFDAVFGAIALIVIPGVSLVTVMFVTETNWANYTFPLLSICFAGLYDTYGRYEAHSAKNFKLGMRAIIDVFAFILTCLFVGSDSKILLALPIILLLMSGLGLGTEVVIRVKTAIEISKWAIWKEEDDDCVVQS